MKDYILELNDLKKQILELLERAVDIIPEGFAKQRAEAYWYPQIYMALINDNGYVGSAGCSMEDTIVELQEEECEGEDE